MLLKAEHLRSLTPSTTPLEKDMKKLLLSSLCAATLAVSAVSYAGDGKPHGHRHHAFAEKLGLTEEQKTELQAMHSQREKPHRGSMRHGMKQLMTLDPQSSNYDQKVSELAEQAAEQARQRVYAKAEKHAKVHDILTPEQREKTKTLHAEMQEKRRERKGKKHKYQH